MTANAVEPMTPPVHDGSPASVPFLRPDLPPWDDVVAELRQSYDAGRFHPAGFVQRAESAFAASLGVKHALLVSTASDGLILLMARIAKQAGMWQPRVAVPAFTFRATPQAVDWVGGRVVAVDCGEDGNLDPFALARVPKPLDAVLAVHVFGLPCDDAAIHRAAPGVPVYYDAAHAMGATLAGAPLAGMGDASVYSLNITKTVPSCGEGGLVATDDDEIADWIIRGRWHGDVGGSLDWSIPGMNAKPTEWQAIVAYHALRRMPEVMARRRAAVARYRELLAGARNVRPLQTEPAGIESAWKDFAVVFPSPELRERAGAALSAARVEFKRYFSPTVPDMAAMVGRVAGAPCPVAQRLARTVICLPIFSTITPAQQEQVVAAILSAVEG